MSSLLTYIIVLSLAAFFMSYSKRTADPAGFLGLGIAIIFAGGRFYVGTDFGVYVRGFMRYARLSWPVFFDKVEDAVLFHAINKLTYAIGGRVLAWSVIMAITIIPIYIALKKQYSDMNLFTAFTFFMFISYTSAFNISREFIAVAIITYSIKYVFENKFKKFLICIFFAALFHSSAVVALILWLFWSHKNNEPLSNGKNAFLILVASVSVFAYQEIIRFASSSVSFLSGYAGFANGSDRGQNRDFYLNLLVFVLVLACYKRLKERDPHLSYMVSILAVSTLIGITGFTHPHVKRIAHYFDVPAQCVIFGYLPSCNLRVSKQTVVFLIYAYSLARFVLTAYILKQANLIPYTFRLY